MRIKIGVAIVGVLLAGSIGLGIWWQNQFRIIRTLPEQNKTHNTQSPIIIEWNKPISDSIKIRFNPEVDFEKTIEGNKLTIMPQQTLIEDQVYALTLSDIKEKNSSAEPYNFTLNFRALTQPFDTLTQEEQQAITKPVDSQYDKYPVTTILPVQHPNFSISGQYVKDQFYVVITPAVYANGLTQEEYESTRKTYIEEARTYILQRGFKLEDYKVIDDQQYLQLTSKEASP